MVFFFNHKKMPGSAFSVSAPLAPKDTFEYLSDLSNAPGAAGGWDPCTLSSEKQGDQAVWKVTFARWPKAPMRYVRVDEGDDRTFWDDNRREGVVVFVSSNEAGNFQTLERFVIVGDGTGSCVNYSVSVGTSGWRKLPCFGSLLWSSVLWAQLAADGARTRTALGSALEDRWRAQRGAKTTAEVMSLSVQVL